MAITQLVLLCRQGFEAETAAEIQDVATDAVVLDIAKPKRTKAG